MYTVRILYRDRATRKLKTLERTAAELGNVIELLVQFYGGDGWDNQSNRIETNQIQTFTVSVTEG